MIPVLKLYLKYFLFWIFFFEIGRLVFVLFNLSSSQGAATSDLLLTFWYGLSLDLSTTGYIMILPILTGILSSIIALNLSRFLKIYSLAVLIILSLLFGIDAHLYEYWGFRFDASPLLYLKTPDIVMKSLSFYDVFSPLLIFSLLSLMFSWLYKRIIIETVWERNLKLTTVLLLLFLALIIPIRGGFDVAPINIGRVYHSENTFLNHSAINVAWNFTFALTESKGLKPIKHSLSKAESRKYLDQLVGDNNVTSSILSTDRPDVLLIILESFTSKLLGTERSGVPVTPTLDSLTRNSVYFNTLFATGDRTDKGLVSILSGYPSQPLHSILKYPKKASSLPNLMKTFNENDYFTSFMYAGDINFANMKAYIQQSGVKKITTKNDFPSETYSAKWGVHDHIMLDTLFSQLSQYSSPFFSTALTISSHEPFDVPVDDAFATNTHVDKFLNAAHYTDQALGGFLEKLKKSPKWNNLLIIITADHGHRLPGNDPVDSKEKFRVPMIWTGGAIDSVKVINRVGSQIDLASTLLHQLQIGSGEYEFSSNLFSYNASFAFYAFNNGYGFISDSTEIVVNNSIETITYRMGIENDSINNISRGYYEYLMYDFEER